MLAYPRPSRAGSTLCTICIFAVIASSPTAIADTSSPFLQPPAIVVEADRFEVNLATEQAVWSGNVHASQGQYTFRTSSLTLHLEQMQSGQSSGSATSPAKKQTDNFELSANALTYDLGDGRIVGQGDSELRRGMEMIRAEHIIYDVDAGTAVARPAENGRVLVRFLSNPEQPIFPTGAR